MRPPDITDLAAHALSRAIHAGEVSCREVMQATLDAHRRGQPAAQRDRQPARRRRRCCAEADARDAELRARRSAHRAGMHGMPQAIKDAAPTAGIRTTLGSPLLARLRAGATTR